MKARASEFVIFKPLENGLEDKSGDNRQIGQVQDVFFSDGTNTWLYEVKTKVNFRIVTLFLSEEWIIGTLKDYEVGDGNRYWQKEMATMVAERLNVKMMHGTDTVKNTALMRQFAVPAILDWNRLCTEFLNKATDEGDHWVIRIPKPGTL